MRVAEMRKSASMNLIVLVLLSLLAGLGGGLFVGLATSPKSATHVLR
jgi:hypothetical protein